MVRPCEDTHQQGPEADSAPGDKKPASTLADRDPGFHHIHLQSPVRTASVQSTEVQGPDKRDLSNL